MLPNQDALPVCIDASSVTMTSSPTLFIQTFSTSPRLSLASSIVKAKGDIYYSVIFIALLGLANSLMWPAIFPLGINHLGKFIKIGSAIMIMGIAGGAVWPQIYAFLKDKAGLNFQLAYFITVLPCYLYILYFAVAGHKVGLKKRISI